MTVESLGNGESDEDVVKPAILPGLLTALIVAAGAAGLAGVMKIPAVLLALALGVVVSAIFKNPAITTGADFASRNLLRIGVVLLGAKIDASVIRGLGWQIIAVTVASMASTVLLGSAVARLLGLGRRMTVLTATAVAVCGASAALAVAAVLPRSPGLERETASVIAAVTVVGSLGMLAYPHLALAAGLPSARLGAFLGISLHELAQAVGAGYAVSERVGAEATTVKLLRVMCLAPIVAVVGLGVNRTRAASAARAPFFPLFLVGFAVMAAANSLRLIPPSLSHTLGTTSQVCLLAAIAGLAWRISIRKLTGGGYRYLFAIVVQSLILAITAFSALAWIS